MLRLGAAGAASRCSARPESWAGAGTCLVAAGAAGQVATPRDRWQVPIAAGGSRCCEQVLGKTRNRGQVPLRDWCQVATPRNRWQVPIAAGSSRCCEQVLGGHTQGSLAGAYSDWGQQVLRAGARQDQESRAGAFTRLVAAGAAGQVATPRNRWQVLIATRSSRCCEQVLYKTRNRGHVPPRDWYSRCCRLVAVHVHRSGAGAPRDGKKRPCK